MHDAPRPGTAEQVMPGLRRLLAPNPSAMTGPGTNTYLVGTGSLAVVDPGPDEAAHLAAILAALGPGERISHIIVTHPHLDHSALTPGLAAATGAPVLGFGGATAGRSAAMAQLAATGDPGGGEGLDTGFAPQHRLANGDVVQGGDWTLEVIHTPGHLGSHICLGFGAACLTGDHVMAWSTSLVSPPDGDMGDYMTSLARLATRDWRLFWPGHGPAVTHPAARLAELGAHRRMREAAILDALTTPLPLPALTRAVYTDLAPALLPAATRNVLAHLVDLAAQGMITAHPHLCRNAIFARR